MEEITEITFRIARVLGFNENKGRGKLEGFQCRKAFSSNNNHPHFCATMNLDLETC